MKSALTIIMWLSVAVLSPILAVGQIDILDIDDFPGATTGKNCTGTHQNVAPPGWEWNCDTGTPNCKANQSGDICGNSEFATTPSRDGQSREMDLSWTYSQGSGTEFGGVNFHATINSSGNGDLDTTDTYFSWGGWFYYTDLSDINQLEFDLNQVLDNGDGTTDTIIYAAQCDFTKDTWHGTWYFSNGWTIKSNIHCPKTDWTINTWHHVVVSAHRGPHSKPGTDIVTYDSVSFDGTTVGTTGTNSANGAFTCPGNSCWEPVGLLLQNVQLDMGFTSAGGTTAYADLMTTNSPQSSQVATPTFFPGAGTYSGPPFPVVTISTTTTGATICYTTDGTTPTANGGGTCTHGITYSNPVTVSQSETLKAIGSKDGIDFDSSIGSALYEILPSD